MDAMYDEPQPGSPEYHDDTTFNDEVLHGGSQMMQLSNSSANQTDFTDEDSSALESFSVVYKKVHGYIVLCICIFGIISNVVNIIVLTSKAYNNTAHAKRSRNRAINIMLTVLACVDVLVLCDRAILVPYFDIINEIHMITMIPNYKRCYDKVWMKLWIADKVFCKGTHLMCMWITVAMAAIRYLMICRKKRFIHSFPDRRTYFIVACILVGCSIIAIPLSLDKTIVNLRDGTNISDCYNVRESDLAVSNGFIKIYDGWFTGLVMQILPSLLMSMFTLLLVKKIRQSVKFRRASTLACRPSMESLNSNNSVRYATISRSSSLKRNGSTRTTDLRKQSSVRDFVRTTKMLVAIVVCSLASDLPLGVVIMTIHFDPLWYIRTGQHLFNPFMVLTYINSSINIIFYCTMFRPFREAAKEVFMPKKCREYFQTELEVFK